MFAVSSCGSNRAGRSSEPASSGAEDPVVKAWMSMDGLMQRAATGRILEVDAHLSRQSVVDNADVLEPLLQHHGSSFQVGT